MPVGPAGGALDRRLQGRIALAAAFVGLGWLWGSPVLWPLSLAVVFLHEASHALVTVLTGGRVLELRLGLDEGGATLSEGGLRFFILNAGYLGSLLSGIALLRMVGRARLVTVGLAAVGLGIALAWMPWLSAGFALVLAWCGFLVWVGFRAPPWASTMLVRLYGVYSVLYAFGDIRADVFGAPGGAVTDATMLSDLTGIPAAAWGIGWMVAGAAALFANRRAL